MENKLPRNWTNTLFFSITPIVAVLGTAWWIMSGNVNSSTITFAVVLFILSEFCITGGYHRFFAHRSYEAALPLKLFFLTIGAGTFQGSAFQWSYDHRNHHRFVDHLEKDPYSIKKGFWWAHIFWTFFVYDKHDPKTKTSDLYADKFVMFQHKNYVPMAIFFAFFFPALIGALWGDFWGGFFIAGVLRLVINHHATFLINSMAHCVGDQTYSDKHTARDHWSTALLTLGEGYHNFHHEFAADYRNGVHPTNWDPTKWLIYLFSLVGLTKNLVRVRKEVIVKARMQMAEKRLAKKLSTQTDSSLIKFSNRVLTRLKRRTEQALARLTKLRIEYQNLKESKLDIVNKKYEIKELKFEIKEAKRNFYHATGAWNRAMNRTAKIIKKNPQPAYANA